MSEDYSGIREGGRWLGLAGVSLSMLGLLIVPITVLVLFVLILLEAQPLLDLG